MTGLLPVTQERWLDDGGSFNREAAIAEPGRTRPAVDRRAPYVCPECARVLRVAGLGRHRVYFELDDAGSERPVINRVCPECGHPLPGKNPR
jgi:hypothetical protein